MCVVHSFFFWYVRRQSTYVKSPCWWLRQLPNLHGYLTLNLAGMFSRVGQNSAKFCTMLLKRILFHYDLKDIFTKFEGSNLMGRLPTLRLKIGQFLRNQVKLRKLSMYTWYIFDNSKVTKLEDMIQKVTILCLKQSINI